MKKIKKNIALIGSTGSIGIQSLEVIRSLKNLFNISVLSTNKNINLIIKQAIEFLPNYVVINDETKYNYTNKKLKKHNIKVLVGSKDLCSIMSFKEIDIVLMAVVGFAGLLPTISAIKAKKRIALANKECLVVGGHIINDLKKEKKVEIIPVDSEHSAVFQCLQGEKLNSIKKITLTASGGPFRGFDLKKLRNVSLKQTLKHPNWSMGKKITVDSATLMNKALEIIEAKWLFDLNINQIDFIIHPQSIIHSFVEFEDTSVIAQLGLPDMKLPIQYALSYPKRQKSKFSSLNLLTKPTLSFEKLDTGVFRSLKVVYDVMKKGGNCPCVFNSANEYAVNLFLNKKINFLDIYKIIDLCLENITFVPNPTINDLLETDFEIKKFLKKNFK